MNNRKQLHPITHFNIIATLFIIPLYKIVMLRDQDCIQKEQQHKAVE